MVDCTSGSVRTDERVAELRRVVWVNRFFYPDESATSIMLTDLVTALNEKGGWQNHLITSRANYTDADGRSAGEVSLARVRRIPALGESNSSLFLRVLNFLIFYAGAFYCLMRDVRRGDVVISLTDPPFIGVISTFVARLKGAQSVNWVQDIYPETATRLGFLSNEGMLARLMRHLRDSAWHRSAINVAIGGKMRDFLIERGIVPGKIKVIQNWTDDFGLQPIARQGNSLRRKWNYDPFRCVVGYSGNLGRAHDIDTMIGAMRILQEAGESSISFLFTGAGARQAELRKAADDMSEGVVAFRPYQPREMLGESLAVPDIHWISLQPQLEGLIVPSKLYGAMAVARPVVFIGNTDGEVARIIRDADCGKSFSPGDSEGLAGYLADLAGNPEKRDELGRNARAYLDTQLCRARRVDQWRELIEELLDHP